MANNRFIDDNKNAILEEIANNINKMNEILSSVLESPIQSELDGSLMRTYMMAMGMQIGSLSTLFNQYFILLNGISQKKERATGFASMLNPIKIQIESKEEKMEPDESESQKE